MEIDWDIRPNHLYYAAMLSGKHIYLLMISFTLLTSFTHILGKPAAVHFPTILLTFLRLTIATVTLTLILTIRKKPFKISRGDTFAFIRLALIGVVGNILLFLWGLKYTIPAHPGLLYATTPVWTLIIAGLFKREIILRQKIIGVFISVVGVMVVMGGTVLNLNLDYLFGDVLILAAVLCWSAYTVFSKPYVMKYHALTATFAITAVGMLVLSPLGIWSAVQFDFSSVPLAGWVGLFYMGMFTSATSYLIYYAVLKQVQPTQLAIIITGQAPTTAILSWLIQGYGLTWIFILGSLLTLNGIYITLKLPPSARAAMHYDGGDAR